MAIIEIKEATYKPSGTLRIVLDTPLSYHQLLSLAGSVSQRLKKMAETLDPDPSEKFEVDARPMRPIEEPEIWFNLGKKYYI
ncbi:MAG: hypothetical protein M1484_04205 [Patescibacteria group bacterium]|nr:hypothetical protein [Patescibacteria group bacterium]MCL5432262.1 hypothetical protein [Patescibacteria group bacterium]